MKKFLLLLSFLCISQTIFGETIYGKIKKIKDGDTVVLLDSNKKQHTIRLAEIDAPEKSQDFGQKSKEYLIKLCANKYVEIKVKSKDRYNRKIGTIFYNEKNINYQMVYSGFAWQYKQYSKSEKLAEYEKSAKINKRGLWAKKNPTPPWKWRKYNKLKNKK